MSFVTESAIRGDNLNWLDIVVLVPLILGAITGVKIGLIKAAVMVVGVYLGWVLAGQYSDDVGAMFGDSLSNDTLVTVVSYAAIVFAAILVSSMATRAIKPLLTIFTLGMSGVVDKIGGLTLGLVLGVAVSGALLIGLARLTYNFELEVTTDGPPETTSLPSEVGQQIKVLKDKIARVEEVKEGLESGLTESQFVPIFIDVTNVIPADALGVIPSDFKATFDILKEKMK